LICSVFFQVTSLLARLRDAVFHPCSVSIKETLHCIILNCILLVSIFCIYMPFVSQCEFTLIVFTLISEFAEQCRNVRAHIVISTFIIFKNSAALNTFVTLLVCRTPRIVKFLNATEHSMKLKRINRSICHCTM